MSGNELRWQRPNPFDLTWVMPAKGRGSCLIVPGLPHPRTASPFNSGRFFVWDPSTCWFYERPVRALTPAGRICCHLAAAAAFLRGSAAAANPRGCPGWLTSQKRCIALSKMMSPPLRSTGIRCTSCEWKCVEGKKLLSSYKRTGYLLAPCERNLAAICSYTSQAW